MLTILDDETFNRLMEEDNDTANKREQLKKEKEKLELAMEKIGNLELGGGRVHHDFGGLASGSAFDDVMDDV